MSTPVLSPVRSERGVALIIVLLLLAVMSAMATGMTVNSQVEITMATNEAYHAGARAAAEGGLNRAIQAIVADTTTDLLAGEDGDPGTADDGDMGFLLPDFSGWPEAIGTKGQYSYTIEILDDDNNLLYATPLSAEQRLQMEEDGDPADNENTRLILRATGFGPNGTVVRISRILESQDDQDITENVTFSNPAILVDGDLTLDGNIHVRGAEGNVHVNGNIVKTGAAGDVSGDITATGTLTYNNNFTAGGAMDGGRASVTVPEINAIDYIDHADYLLKVVGGVAVTLNKDGTACTVCGAWSYSGGTWTTTSNSASPGTYYVEGQVTIAASSGALVSKALSVIATGSIDVQGRSLIRPENDAYIQFVTNGDLSIQGNSSIDDNSIVEGQSLVREQFSMSGTAELAGRIVVKNATSVSTLVTANLISGTPTITYTGSLGPIPTTTTTFGAVTYVNNVSGWMESQ